MNKETYIKQILRHIKVSEKTKERIRLDILSDVENLEEQGLSMEEIMAQMGTPEEVAREFGQNSSEPLHHRKRRGLRVFAILCAAASGVCLTIGSIGRFLFLGSPGTARIGGADEPTDIFVVAEPLSPLTIYDGLIKAAILLLLAAVLCAVYLFIKNRGKGK